MLQQMTIDLGDQDICYGRTSSELYQAMPERTSASSSKKSQKSQTKAFQFLDLTGGAGRKPEQSWQTSGVLLGVYTTRSFGECPKEDVVSHLSQILTDRPHPKYYLSERACNGVIDRAERRGKGNFPDELRKALEEQAKYLNEHPDAIRLETEWYEAQKDEYSNKRGSLQDKVNVLTATIAKQQGTTQDGCLCYEAKAIDQYNHAITGEKSCTLGVNCGLPDGRGGGYFTDILFPEVVGALTASDKNQPNNEIIKGKKMVVYR